MPVPDGRRTTGPEWAGREHPRFSRERDRMVATGPMPPVPVPVPEAAAAEAGVGVGSSAQAPRRERPRDPVPRTRSPHRKVMMLAALAAGCVVIGAGAALIGDNGNNGGKDPTAPRATASKSQGAPTGGSAQRASAVGAGSAQASSSAPSSTAPAPTSGDPSSAAGSGDGTGDTRSAAQINNAGYAMLPGDPQGALPLLQAAVAKFRAQGDTKSTDYAYSLYNLGWALRLAGRPDDAIPYLQERLQISSYKRGIVEKELATARQQAAGGGATADAKPKPGKKGKGHQHGPDAGGPGGLLGGD
jgi:serine/threonine-protein kinase